MQTLRIECVLFRAKKSPSPPLAVSALVHIDICMQIHKSPPVQAHKSPSPPVQINRITHIFIKYNIICIL